jgi:GNAT superfamily N-acetyltransferase
LIGMTITPYTIRPATIADAATLGALRAAMQIEFAAPGALTPARVAALNAAAERYYATHTERGTVRSWLAVTAAGEPIAAASALLYEQAPSLSHPAPRPVAYVFGVYTDTGHRRRGLARALMRELLAWARESGVEKVELRASDAGRQLYEGLGFQAIEVLRLRP